MDKFDRIFQLHTILSARRTPIHLEGFSPTELQALAVVHRLLKDMGSGLLE
jgi:hypothetical protein